MHFCRADEAAGSDARRIALELMRARTLNGVDWSTIKDLTQGHEKLLFINDAYQPLLDGYVPTVRLDPSTPGDCEKALADIHGVFKECFSIYNGSEQCQTAVVVLMLRLIILKWILAHDINADLARAKLDRKTKKHIPPKASIFTTIEPGLIPRHARGGPWVRRVCMPPPPQ
jgi:hypothetical protein